MHTLHAFMHACYTIVYGRYIPALTLHRFEASSWGQAFRSCRAACLNCTNCAYISVSLVDSECSWSSACNLGRLKLRDKERFRTTLVRELEDSPDRQRLRQDSLFAGHPEITRNCAPHFPPSVLAHVKTLDAPQPLDAPRPLALRGVSIQAPLDHGVGWWGGSCRKLVGNHMHQLLNAILLSEIFNVPLLRQAAGHNYTCGGLLQSTGKFEELPAHGQNAKPISWCGAGDLIKVVPSGEFKMRPGLHSMANCGNLVRWHAQEAAIFRLLPTGGNQRIFRHGPHYAFGQTFRRYFRFKGPDPHFKEDVLRIGVHLRHRRPCFNGSELVPAVLQLAKELAAGQKYMLLVASDRRLSIQLLRASGGLVKSVPRDGKASETAVFAENGEDVGYVSLQDIRLLSFSHHLIGTYGSTFTMLAQELVAFSQPLSTVTYCEPGTGCTTPRPLRGDWHFSLQNWPKGTIVQHRTSHGGSGGRSRWQKRFPEVVSSRRKRSRLPALPAITRRLQRRPLLRHKGPGHRMQRHRGHCGATEEDDHGKPCSNMTRGAWTLQTPFKQSWQIAVHECRKMCLQCEPCQFISVSLVHQECSWYAACDVQRLSDQGSSFFTFHVREQSPQLALAQPVGGAADVESSGKGVGSDWRVLPFPDDFVRIDFQNRSCCSFDGRNLTAHGLMLSRWKPGPAATLTKCLDLCKNDGPKCQFVTHLAAVASELGECRRCSLCQLYGWSGQQPSSSWARQLHQLTDQGHPSTFVLQKWLPPDELSGPYSRRVYGAPGRAPSMAALQLLWIDLLAPLQRATIGSIGVCSRAGGTPLQPLFTSVLRNALFVQQPHLVVHAPVPSYAWAEVVHCPLSAGPHERITPGFRYAPMWMYVASGAGVSVNVGRTFTVGSFFEAEMVLRVLFPIPASALHLHSLSCDTVRSRRTGMLGAFAASAKTKFTDSQAQEHQELRGNLSALLRQQGVLGRGDGDRQLDVFLGKLDSLQIVNHIEFYAHTALHELVMLRQAECQRLSHSMEGLMCGAFPVLRNCSADDEALRRMNTGCGPIEGVQWNAAMRYSDSLTKLLGREPKPTHCRLSAGCYTEALDPNHGRMWCPQGLLNA